MNNKSLDFRENSSLVCCWFLHLSAETTHFTTVHDTKIKAVWLPKTLCAKRQQLLALKVGQILALNYVKVSPLTVSLLTTMMTYNTECLIYLCQISRKPLPSNSTFKMEVASSDPLSQLFPAVPSVRMKLLQKANLRSSSLLWGSLCNLCGKVLG